MNREELIHKLADLEWEDFEVKAAKGELPKDTWETVSAFSNTSGGWLLFGVRQNGKTFEIQGVSNPEKIEQDFLNTIRGGKFNVFVPTKQAKHTIDGKTVIAFYVPVSKEKPVYYNSLQNTFIRRGSSDQRATNEEIDAMFRDQTFGTKTSELAPGTTRDDIHEKSLKQYRDYMGRFNPDVSYNRYDEDEFLRKLRILDNGNCTYAGLLFLGKRERIEKHFPDFRIDLLEIPGTSISDAATNYTFRLDEYENLWDYYFECFRRLKPQVDVEFKLTSEGFGEELSTGLKAMREALVNMLMHADYFSPAHSRIRIFTNHIEFFNPGGLPKPLEELKEKDISLPRNPLISKLFRMVRLAENAGYGFEKIETNWKQFNGTAPVYDIAFDSTIVKLYTEGKETKPSERLRKDFGELSEKLRKAIENKPASIDLIMGELEESYEVFTAHLKEKFGLSSETVRRQFGDSSETVRRRYGDKAVVFILLVLLNKEITATEASEIMGVTTRTVEKYIKKLKTEGIIERIGADFGGYWTIKKD
ncbi:RNA-binding domain-containing protein [Mangrovibacterium lignilyticum]|uniref:RNA-binding domain-containing protein n=1 Tax=Mangrovibacterium lignilyticum TaxID=2668052 RepID=UPI0013D89A66|nr:RNA-binding domain-containing protein [Mangrovibacterium lignilyticum]